MDALGCQNRSGPGRAKVREARRQAPALPPSVVEEPAAPPLLSPVRRVLSAALQPPARAAGPADERVRQRGQVGGLKSALLAQAQALLPTDERDPPGPLFETRLLLRQTPEAGLGRATRRS